MSDESIWDAYKALRKAEQDEGQQRRDAAAAAFPEVARQAKIVGMSLRRFSDTHYRLTVATWLYDIYPGNMRIVRSPVATQLELPDEWTLSDVLAAAIQAVNKCKS